MSLKKGLARAGRTLDSPCKTLADAPRYRTLENPAGWLTGEDGVGLSRDRAMKISTVNRCVEVLSNSMAVLPVYIMDESSKGRLPDHRLGRVLWGRANEAMTTFDYQRLMMSNQLLRGNAYAWIDRDPGSGYPRQLIPLPPDFVSPQIDSAGHLWYFFTLPATGEVTRLRPEDVLHYKSYSEDGLNGISVLRRATMTLDTARSAQQYENSTWRSGGQPSGILTTDSDLGDLVERTRADGTKVLSDPK
ncbi:MAG: phage portal protein, partial [Oscillospiraceae bacterium]